jgi:hypothetical protein
MIRAGDLPFSVRISSSDGEGSEILMEQASVTIDGRTTVVVGGPLALAVNAVDGEKAADSSAAISIPVDGVSPGVIRTAGNATVSVGAVQSSLALSGNVNRLKARSTNGLFAVARVKIQYLNDHQYFDLLFGVRGLAELPDAAGQKQRPHLAFRPDGSGQFIRLAGTRCADGRSHHARDRADPSP